MLKLQIAGQIYPVLFIPGTVPVPQSFVVFGIPADPVAERKHYCLAIFTVFITRIHKSYLINIGQIEFIEKGRIIINKQYLPVESPTKKK